MFDREQLKREVCDKVERVAALADAVRAEIDSLPDLDYRHVGLNHNLGLHIHVKSRADWRVVRRHFKGRLRGHSAWCSSAGGEVHSYGTDTGLSLFITYSPLTVEEGGVCRRVQIGVEERPVWRYECEGE